MELGDQVRQMAESPNCVPRRGKTQREPTCSFVRIQNPAHLLQENRMWCGAIKMHLSQQRP